MTITNNQLIDSVRALLRETILPELQSDIARARLRQIMATLRDVDWDEAPLAMLRENAALQQLLDASTSPAGKEAVVTTFQAALARNHDLRCRIADQLTSSAASGWGAMHTDAARLLADCAHRRARVPHESSKS